MSVFEIHLADLVGDVEAFAADHWGRSPLLRPSGHDFTELLSVESAERLLLTSARRPTFRLVRNGERLPPERSATEVRMGGTTLTDVADPSKIADEMADGATLVLQALQRTWPPVIDLCHRLEQELSHPVQANAYLTPAGAKGLARHADEHDVLVLQCTGAKRWDADGLGAVELAPGDVLYVPAGTRHAAAAQDAPSLHLTIGVLRVTYRSVVRRLLDRLDDADLDDPLPLRFAASGGGEELPDELVRRLRLVADALTDSDGVDLASDERRRARRRVRSLGTGRLQSMLALDRIEPSTVVRRDDAFAEVRTSEDGQRLSLVLPDRVVEIPVAARPALDRLLEGDEEKVGELPGLSDHSRRVLVRRLVREGFLRLVHE